MNQSTFQHLILLIGTNPLPKNRNGYKTYNFFISKQEG